TLWQLGSGQRAMMVPIVPVPKENSPHLHWKNGQTKPPALLKIDGLEELSGKRGGFMLRHRQKVWILFVVGAAAWCCCCPQSLFGQVAALEPWKDRTAYAVVPPTLEPPLAEPPPRPPEEPPAAPPTPVPAVAPALPSGLPAPSAH